MIPRKIIPLLLCLFSLHAFSQKTFLITNDDPFRRPNSVSTYSVQSDGSLLLVGRFATGGNGGGNSGDPSGQGIGHLEAWALMRSAIAARSIYLRLLRFPHLDSTHWDHLPLSPVRAAAR
jgi:hypothetical protein